MTGSTISDLVSMSVTLGAGLYSSPLTITSTGTIIGDAGHYGNIGGAGGTGLDASNGTVTNSGAIAGGAGGDGSHGGYGGSGGTGVSLDAGGNLSNMGLITGGGGGYSPGLYGKFYADGGAGADVSNSTLTNHGTILGGASGNGADGGAGVNLTNGIVTNDGSIAGVYGGFFGGAGVAVAGGTLSNNGMITGGSGFYAGAGVTLASGVLTNNGTIAGGYSLYYGGTGVDITNSTLTNEGTITGGNGHNSSGGIGVLFHGGGTLNDAGFIGGGNGGTADAVEFGTAVSRLILDPGASFSGSVVADAAFSNVLELADPAGAGEIIGLGDTIIGFGTIAFDQGASWLLNGNAAGLAAGQTIDGFHFGDTIELTGFVESGHFYTSDGLVLTGTGGNETIGIQGAFTTTDFNVSTTGGNSFVELQPACFAAGTRIATERGEIAVEALAVGDQVRVLLGNALAPIIWIGRRTADCARHPKPRQVWPVRVSAGAFGPGVPRIDVWLSPDHAVYVGKVLIPVKLLVNGSTIAQVPVDRVTYYHLELAEHDVLLAEGLPAESYLDMRDGSNYAHRSGPIRLYPDYAARTWEAFGCARLIVTGPELAAARALVESLASEQVAA